MTFNSIGDLAQGFALRRQNTLLNQQMSRLSQELTSGLTSDVSDHLKGNLFQLADIQHRLKLNESFERGAAQGRVETAVMQTALETAQGAASALSAVALAFGSGTGVSDVGVFAGEARSQFSQVVIALNADVGGRVLFGGDQVTRAPLPSADEFLTAVQTAVAGAASAADVNTALDAFFDPGGDFETLIYQGGNTARGAYQLGDGDTVVLDLRADAQAFRNAFKQMARTAVLDDPGVTLTLADQYALASQTGEALLGTKDQLTIIRGDLGFAEAQIDRAATRIAAEQSSLALVQSDLLAVDPFEKATELETVQLRLETLYTITSRMSRLNLVNFL
ncbi:MAG: flagellin [Roseovarius sp.]